MAHSEGSGKGKGLSSIFRHIDRALVPPIASGRHHQMSFLNEVPHLIEEAQRVLASYQSVL